MTCTIDNLSNAFINTLFLYIYLTNIGLYWCYIHIDLAFCNPLGSNINHLENIYMSCKGISTF